jgi:hypothetical protein
MKLLFKSFCPPPPYTVKVQNKFDENTTLKIFIEE